MRILIVEDEIRLAESLSQIMKDFKYETDIVYNGEDALVYADSCLYDMIILDVMIPKKNGFEVVKELRKKKNAVPVLLLTAKDDVSDKVTGLDSGADDYMTKPFSPEELMARVRALSRRQGDVVISELSFGDLVLNLSAYTLHCGHKSVHLGYKEFKVLQILMSNSKIVVPKEDLIIKVWGYESDAADNNVEAYISFLRKKFYYLGSNVNIGTVRKVGYKLEMEVK